jgi:hypothetical protein
MGRAYAAPTSSPTLTPTIAGATNPPVFSCGDTMTVSGTFVSFASSTLVQAPAGSDYAMGTYTKVANVTHFGRPIYRRRDNDLDLYLCYTSYSNAYSTDKYWAISAEPCKTESTLILYVYAQGTDAPCPDQVTAIYPYLQYMATTKEWNTNHYITVKQSSATASPTLKPSSTPTLSPTCVLCDCIACTH